MTNGKNKDILRELFKEENPTKIALTKAGGLSKDYESFLMKACKPHWASVLSKFGKKVDEIDEGKLKAQEALDACRKDTILEEKCSLGIGGKIASRKKLWETKYGIKF